MSLSPKKSGKSPVKSRRRRAASPVGAPIGPILGLPTGTAVRGSTPPPPSSAAPTKTKAFFKSLITPPPAPKTGVTPPAPVIGATPPPAIGGPPVALPSLITQKELTKDMVNPIYIPESRVDPKDVEAWMPEVNTYLLSPVTTQFYEWLKRIRINPDVVSEVMKPEEIIMFASNNAYNADVVREMRDIMRFWPGADQKTFENWVKKSVGKGVTGLEADPSIRIKWLGIAAKMLEHKKQLAKFGYIMSNDQQYKHKISKADMNMIELKQISEINPIMAMEQLVRMDRKLRFSGGDKIRLKNLSDQFADLKMQYSGGLISPSHFENATEVIMDAMSNIVEKYGGLQTWRDVTDTLHRKVYTVANHANSVIKKIVALNEQYPDNNVAKHLDQMLDSLKEDLRSGRISLNSFYARINTIGKMMKPQLEPQLKTKRPQMHLNLEYELKSVKQGEEKDVYDDVLAADDLREAARKHGMFATKGLRLSSKSMPVWDSKNNFFVPLKFEVKEIASDIKNLSNMDTHITDSSSGKVYKIGELDRTAINKSSLVHLEDLRDRLQEAFVKYTKMVKPQAGKYRIFDDKIYAAMDPGEREKELKKHLPNVITDIQDTHNWLVDIAKKKIPFPSDPAMMSPNEKAYWYDVKLDPTKKRIVKHIVNRAAGKYYKPKILEQPVELAQSEFIDEGATEEERKRNKEKREKDKKYSQENFVYARRISKEEPELLKAAYGPDVTEYIVKTEADLSRMKFEVSKQPGDLYIIDPRTGRLYPIDVHKAFIKNIYIFMRRGRPKGTGGSFAYHPVLNRIHEDSQSLFPYEFLRGGNDKILSLIHRLPDHPFQPDYRHELNEHQGGSFWKQMKKGIRLAGNAWAVATPGVNIAYAIPPVRKAMQNYGNDQLKHVEKAAPILLDDTKREAVNYLNQQKKHVNMLYQANSKFINNPNISTFGKAFTTTMSSGHHILNQQGYSAAREVANVSDFAGRVPSLNIAKNVGEFLIPPAKVVDALSHAVKSSGVGSDDKADPLDTAIALGDAVIGSRYLKGAPQLGMRVLNTGAKTVDYFMDKNDKK